MARQSWRLTFAEVTPDQAQVLLRGVAADAHLALERFVLARLLDALPGGIVFPAVVQAAEAVVLHPAARQLRAAMGAAEGHDVSRAGLAPIQREALAQDLYRDGSARRQVLRAVDRLPETA